MTWMLLLFFGTISSSVSTVDECGLIFTVCTNDLYKIREKCLQAQTGLCDKNYANNVRECYKALEKCRGAVQKINT